MATGMRKWILAVGVACTVCGAWLLPPEPWDPFLPRFSRQTPERTEARRIGTALQVGKQLLDARADLPRVEAARDGQHARAGLDQTLSLGCRTTYQASESPAPG